MVTADEVKNAKQELLKGFVANSNTKSSMSNQDIKDLSDKAKQNGTDISVKKNGEEVEIKKQDGETGIGGNTTTQTLAVPSNLQNHLGYAGRFQLRATAEADRTFRMELINNSFDFVDFGPIHARNEANITLKSDSPRFGTLIPVNPRSTSLLYEGTASASASVADIFPAPQSNIILGIKIDATKSNLQFRLPFRGGVRVGCVEGRNTGTHTGNHQFAVDLGVPRGTEVLAAFEGVVVDVVSSEPDMPIGTRGTGDGNQVRIRHRDLTYGIYGHLLQNGVRVTVGQQVSAGTLLGLSGNSGNTNGDHLHFAVERATLTSFETVDWSFFDNASNAFVPVAGNIYECAGGQVNGKLISGNGDPNGKDAGDVGDVYVRLDGSPGTVYYVKGAGRPWRSRWER